MSSEADDSAWWQQEFKTLTVPAETLPGGCELVAAALPLGARGDPNPMVTNDPQRIGSLIGVVLWPDLEADLPPDEASAVSRDEQYRRARKMLQQWAAKQAAGIEALYSARYVDSKRKELGVWALKFRNPKEAQTHFNRLGWSHETDSELLREVKKNYHYFISGTILVATWADSEDPSCIDAIRGHLKKVTLNGSKARVQQEIQIE